LIDSVRLRVVSKCCRLLRADVVLIFVLRFFPNLAFSSVNSSSSFLHSADKGKDILGKFVLVGGRIVEENHEFCSMEEEYILDEVEGEAAESVGNHNF
jgi:hypothetical protein